MGLPTAIMRFDLAGWGAELTPERPAIWANGRWLSYRDINARATCLANHLHGMGLGFGERVGLLAENHLAHFDLALAAAKLGFIFVPFDPRQSVATLRDAARVVAPSLVISDLRHETLAAQAFSCPRIDLEEYRDWLGYSSRRPLDPVELSAESIHSIVFSTGAVGEHHAVLVPYRQLLANARATAIEWGLGPEDSTVQVSACWQAGMHGLSIPLLAVGGRVVLPTHPEAEEVLRVSRSLEVTSWMGAAADFAAVVAHADFDSAPLDRLRHAWLIGPHEASDVGACLAQRTIAVRPVHLCAEAGFNALGASAEANPPPGAAGRALAHVDAQVRDPQGAICEPGQRGELTLAGEGLSAGYLDAAGIWSHACRDGYFRTGQSALCDAEGWFFLLDQATGAAVPA